MLEVKNLDIIISTRYVIRDLSFTLQKGDKLAVIGEEGNGKSTLLKAIMGLCDYDLINGTVDTKRNTVGYLEQYIRGEECDKDVYDFLFASEDDYYKKVSSLYKWLNKFGLSQDILNQKISTLSGGEKVKVDIMRLLLEDADILLLDEPTNDLDIETLEWLEGFITYIDKPILYVSHDEVLLEKTANMILHLEQLDEKTVCKHTLLKVGYKEYMAKRIAQYDKQMQIANSEKNAYDKKRNKLLKVMQQVDYEQRTISRGDPHGAALLKKKMHALKSQERRLEKTELTEKPEMEESIRLIFDKISLPRNKAILKLCEQDLRIENKVLASNINLEIFGPTHICIVGKNGAGKTTLIKKIYEVLKYRDDIRVGYMPQTYEDILNDYENALDFVASKNKDSITKARLLMGSMNFTRDEMVGRIDALSDGTKAKLFLIKLVLEGYDVLLLDEPTRNLSPLSAPVVREILKNYGGAIISISHDRKYIEEVADITYVLKSDGLTEYKL